MKFAKELEDDLVPEWRLKYLDYKAGKKKIKAVTRALRNVNKTPQIGGTSRPTQDGSNPPSEALPYTHYDFTNRAQRPPNNNSTQQLPRTNTATRDQSSRPEPDRRESLTLFTRSPPVLMPDLQFEPPEYNPERQPLNIPGRGPDQLDRRYGSIVGTPPYAHSPPPLTALELPDPAINFYKGKKPQSSREPEGISPRTMPKGKPPPDSPDPYHVGPNQPPQKFSSSLPRNLFRSKEAGATNNKNTFPQSKLRRMFSTAGLESPGTTNFQLDAYRELDAKQDEFFQFLDRELDKIEKFYKSKEEEASDRLRILRDQLHELRDRRMEDIRAAKQGKRVHDQGLLEGLFPVTPLPTAPFKDESNANGHGPSFLQPIEDAVRRKSHIGKTSKAMENLGSPTHPEAKAKNDDKKDYTRRNHTNERVPYRFAKRRLKLALQEFYRALELLKSYALLNRTGFRKINKKYDKAVNARPTLRYMTEKVNKSSFVQSNVIEGHLVAVEDLYARYFEQGNHKIAVGKLRTKLRSGDVSPNTFRNGLFIAAGAVFGVQGLINGVNHLHSDDPTISTQASYILQLYAGYFLSLLLFLLFVLDCRIWTAARINYVFVFEYDTRHVLDWRQLAEIPCFFLFLNGLFIWLNFRHPVGVDAVYLFYPLALIAISLIIMCFPFPVLYYNARKWWGFSNWRLFFAGLYPVEFRDFYLGDMYCSETYAMSQIEVFFCLYVNDWVNPPQCNSNHSRLLGFFTTLPAIWRALQCLRRYYDSRNWFPHLANFAKYCGNILYYMSLSMYRIHRTSDFRAIFIVFASINGAYCSFWDVAMDFSLGNPYAHHPFLRDNLGYRKVWVYYAAMVLDVILRQQWIFYAIFAHDLQHSAAMSFFVGLAEVLRRGMWSLFRVENEHCNNVGKFRASRDIDLPYSLPPSPEINEGSSPKSSRKTQPDDSMATGVDVEQAATQAVSGTTLRRRKSNPLITSTTPGIHTLQRVGTVIARAHALDFEKKKRPEDVAVTQDPRRQQEDNHDSSDEEDDDDDNIEDEEPSRSGDDEEDVMEARTMRNRGGTGGQG